MKHEKQIRLIMIALGVSSILFSTLNILGVLNLIDYSKCHTHNYLIQMECGRWNFIDNVMIIGTMGTGILCIIMGAMFREQQYNFHGWDELNII